LQQRPASTGKGFKTAVQPICPAALVLQGSGATPLEQERTKYMTGSPRYTVPCVPRPISSYTCKPWRSAAASVPSSALVEWHEHRLPAHTQRSGRSSSWHNDRQSCPTRNRVQYLCRSGARQRAPAAGLQQAGRRKGLQRGKRPPRPALSAARAFSGSTAPR